MLGEEQEVKGEVFDGDDCRFFGECEFDFEECGGLNCTEYKTKEAV